MGSRTKNLRDYAQQLENNVDNKILAQKDCNDQLNNFFNVGLGNLAVVINFYYIFQNHFFFRYNMMI